MGCRAGFDFGREPALGMKANRKPASTVLGVSSILIEAE
jgi:hypothetical protein